MDRPRTSVSAKEHHIATGDSEGRRSPSVRLRLLGTPLPAVDYALAAILLVFGIGAVALSGASSAGWVVLAAAVCAAAYFVAVGLWSARHRDEIQRHWQARRARTRASMRRHPLRWLIGMPIAAGLDAALRWNRYHHHSLASTAIAAAGGVLVGLVVVVIALRRARHGNGPAGNGHE